MKRIGFLSFGHTQFRLLEAMTFRDGARRIAAALAAAGGPSATADAIEDPAAQRTTKASAGRLVVVVTL